jgi:hypothetical protein
MEVETTIPFPQDSNANQEQSIDKHNFIAELS